MTKLQLLNAFLTKRLMVAVQEILEMVENTVSEYQEETARTKRENESLRWKLREVGLETEAAFCQGDAILASRGKCPTEEQCCEKEWSSSLRQQDPELTLTEEKQELSEEQSSTQRVKDPVCGQITESSDRSTCCISEVSTQVLERAGSIFTAQSVKNDDPDSVNPSHLFKIRLVNTEVDSVPNFISSQIKAEPEVDYSMTEQPTDSETFSTGNPVCMSSENVSVESWSASHSEAQESEETQEEVHGQRSYCCPECEKSFSHACHLKLHMRIHTGEKPYCCTECGKYFNHAGHFKVHQRIHTGEKPYSCPQCGKCFKQIGHLNVHVRIHTGEKPYVCTVCGKGFIESGTLKIHCRTHTGERPYCCSLCGKTYNRRTHLNHHLRTHSRVTSL